MVDDPKTHDLVEEFLKLVYHHHSTMDKQRIFRCLAFLSACGKYKRLLRHMDWILHYAKFELKELNNEWYENVFFFFLFAVPL